MTPHFLQLFAGLLALGVMAFLAFFLVGTMASLKWLNRNDDLDPEPIALGGMAMKEVAWSFAVLVLVGFQSHVILVILVEIKQVKHCFFSVIM